MINIFRKNLFKYFIIVAIVAFLYFFGVLAPVEGLVSRYLNPVFVYFQGLSTSVSKKYYEQTSKTDIVQKNRELEEKINELLGENAGLKVIKEENEIMRQYLDFFSSNDYRNFMAGVVSRGDFSDSAGRIEIITIDKGSRDGMYTGLVVINEEGMVVGKIGDVKESISEVQLITNSSCKIAATIFGYDKTSGIVRGELGLTMEMNFIPQSKSISKGNLVITSGLEQAIPRGLVVGQVAEVVKESNELWQEAVIESSVNLSELLIVSVLLPDIDNN